MSEVKRYDLVGDMDGNCNLNEARMELSYNGVYVKHRDYEALQAKCAALEVENAGLKAAAKETLAHWAAAEPGEMEQMMDKCMPNLRIAYCETPATDAFLAEVRAHGVKSLSNAVQSVIAERQRHQSVEGWTPEHDDQYSKSQLLWASSCYVMNAIHPFNRIPFDWPWDSRWWKPTSQRRDLVKAGALILAEIERIDRQEAAQ